MKVRLTDFSEDWVRMFQTEADFLTTIFGDEIVKFEHFGSTSVQGMKAKPVIDMMCIVKDIDKIDSFNHKMNSLEYDVAGEWGITGRRLFRKGGENRTHHVHFYQVDNPHIERHLIFRDYLRSHPEEIAKYNHFKDELAQRFENTSEYSPSKKAFVKEMEQKALLWFSESQQNTSKEDSQMKKVLVFITDGFADWEASYVTAELNKPGTGFHVQTIAIDKDPKTSMGGLTVLPDYSLQDFSFELEIAMLIVPGGTGWREEKNQQAKRLVDYCFNKDIPVAAICDATTFLGNHGFLDYHKHTGNSLPYLKEGAPNYNGGEKYIAEQSVSDGCLITANGSAALEFSRDILGKLNVLEGQELNEWYDLFKKGFIQG